MQIPGWILAQDAQGRRHGTLNGATMFVDISGFSALTGKLMEHGKEGAEILAGTLRFYFDPLVEAVYAAHGLITGFAGDAFTAVFPNDGDAVADRVLQAALSMQEFFREHAVFENAYGCFPFAVKIGVSWGDVEWGIIDTSDTMATYYFRGPGVDNCARAEHFADKGMLILDQAFLERVPNAIVEPVAEGAFLCRGTIAGPLAPKPAQVVHGDTSRFLHPGIGTFPPGGEFRRVVAVFLSFGEVDDLPQLARILQAELERYGGMLTRFDFGDKGCNALVFFGVPISYENDLERALDCVLSFWKQCPEHLDVRAGITRDICYAGYNGGTQRNEFTCLGRATNLAARLMMKANWGDIWCSPSIYERMHTRYQMEHAGLFPFKGFTEPVDVYRLSDKRAFQELEFGAQTMVGREEEVSQVHQCVARALEGAWAGLCYVDGEPGMGKSYLVDSYRRELSSVQLEGSFRWIYAPCDQTLHQSLHPLAYALRSYFQQSVSLTKVENRQLFDNLFAALLQKLPPAHEELARELERVRSFLAALVGLREEGSLYEQLDPKLRFDNTLSAISTWLTAESMVQPVVLQIEDAQWLDDDSEQALLSLSRVASNTPLAVVLTCRYLDDGSPYRLSVGDDVAQTVVNLNQLTERGLRQLVENQIGGPASAALLGLVADKSRGNPFFAEQIIGYLQDNHGLELTQDGYSPVTTGVILPDEVNAVLVARLDRLASDIKQIVQVASVLGQQFDVQILSAVLRHLRLFGATDSWSDASAVEAEGEPLSLEQGEGQTIEFADLTVSNDPLTAFLSKGIQVATEEQIWSIADELHYLFRHALLRDAAYDMQARARLRQLHALSGASFELVYGEDLSPYLGEVAYHYDRAEATDKAILYLEQAGDLARMDYHNSEAIAYYTRLLELHPPDGEQIRRVCLSLARVLQLTARLDEGLAYCQKAEDALPTPSPEVRYQRAILLMMQGKLKEAQDMAQDALQMARDLGDLHWEATSLIGLGGLLLYSGDIETAWSHFEEGLAIAHTSNKPELEAKALNNMAGVASKRGDLTQALELLKRSLTLKQQCKDRWGETITLGNLGELYLDLNEPQTALSYLEEAQRNCDELGSHHPPFLLHQSEALRRLGHTQAAWEVIRTARERAKAFGNPKYISLGALFEGHILRELQRKDEARLAYEEAMTWATKRKLKSFQREAQKAIDALQEGGVIPLSFPR